MVVAVLGVMKSGAAYVPLDPGYPPRRLGLVLQDAACPLVLTLERCLDVLPDGPWETVCLDGEGSPLAEDDGDDVAPTPPGPDDVAYVVHTSGSTGRPKGVMTTHRGVVNYVRQLVEAHGIGPSDRALQVASLSFDASVRELLAPLAVGGTVVLVPHSMAGDPDLLVSEVRRRQVTCLLAVVPTMLDALTAAALERGAGCPGVRLVLVSGEPLGWSQVARAQEVFGIPARVVNLYGPTECTMTSTCWAAPAARGREGMLQAGLPIANVRVRVLDGDLRPVPFGVAGEVFIGGPGLARGYLGRPGPTAAAFVPDPFGAPGERLYRTGDRGRLLPDGLRLLGRIDEQVKVRGVRVEPGEIEAAAVAHPLVRQAAVRALEDGSGGRRLAVYVTLQAGARLPERELLVHLRELLPEHMVPGVALVLPAFPVLPNGKVDRRALPEPGPPAVGPDASGRLLAPEEEIVAGIFAGVLGRDHVGPDDDFFELGGHSLLAIQVISRVRAALGAGLGVRSVFERPTVAGLVGLVRAARSDPGQEPPPLRPVPRGGELPLSFAQERLWFLAQLVPDSPDYNLAVALRLRGDLNIPVLGDALSEVVRRHEVLRTRFPSAGGRPRAVVAGPGPVPLPVIDLAAGAGEQDVELLAGEEAMLPFDLEHGPLLRAALLRVGGRAHVLLLTVHHAVSDVWSRTVLLRELAAHYRAFAAGRPSPLPELPLQYADYAAWQRQWLRGEALEERLGYWRERLAGLEPLELPADRPRPAVETHRGAQRRVELDAQLTGGLRGLSRRQGVTLFMTLLAGFQALLARYSGQQDVAVGTPVANRDRVELEGLIGFFVDTLVLRTDLGGDPSFRELLERVREVTLGAHSHHEVPFEKLVDELRPVRDPSRNPLFQVMLALQNVPREEPELPGLDLDVLPVSRPASKFDLSLSLWEQGEGLAGVLTYSTDLFEAATVDRLVGHLRLVLEAMVADPDTRVWELPLLDDTERRQLEEWHRSKRPAFRMTSRCMSSTDGCARCRWASLVSFTSAAPPWARDGSASRRRPPSVSCPTPSDGQVPGWRPRVTSCAGGRTEPWIPSSVTSGGSPRT